MPVHLSDYLEQNRHSPGILVLRPKATMGAILDDLVLVAEVDDLDELRDRIVYIPL